MQFLTIHYWLLPNEDFLPWLLMCCAYNCSLFVAVEAVSAQPTAWLAINDAVLLLYRPLAMQCSTTTLYDLHNTALSWYCFVRAIPLAMQCSTHPCIIYIIPHCPDTVSSVPFPSPCSALYIPCIIYKIPHCPELQLDLLIFFTLPCNILRSA